MQFSRRGGTAFLTLNRPDKLNALTYDLFQELREHITEIRQRTDDIGVVVIRGAGRCFSAGHDMADLGAEGSVTRLIEEAKIIEQLANLPQPVVAAVHSHCYTGALELALAADIILASTNSRFADTHAKFSLTPFWGMSQRLPRRVGRAVANDLSLSGRTIGAEEAAAIGLSNHLFDKSTFEVDVDDYCATLLKNSWFSLQAYKRLMNETERLSLSDGLQWEIQKNGGFGPDMMERVKRFTHNR